MWVMVGSLSVSLFSIVILVVIVFFFLNVFGSKVFEVGCFGGFGLCFGFVKGGIVIVCG